MCFPRPAESGPKDTEAENGRGETSKLSWRIRASRPDHEGGIGMRHGLGWIGLGAFLWGTAGLAGKVLITRHGMDPLVIGAWRLAISAPVLILAAIWESRSQQAPVKSWWKWGWMWVFGLAVAGYQVGYFSAVDRTLVSTATMLTVCTAPLVVAILARALLKEQLSISTLVALAVGLAGTVLLLGAEGLAGLTDSRLMTGNALALFAALCYGGYTLVGKHLLADAPPFRVLAVAFSLGALLLSPVIRLPEPSKEAWLLLCYLGVIPTAVAYLFYMHGLRRSTATRAAVVALLEPLTAALLALVFLGERLTLAGWVGAGLLLSSLVLMQWRPESVGKEQEPRQKTG